MSKSTLKKFSKGLGWVANEVNVAYQEKIRHDQFIEDMIGCSVILIDLGKSDLEIYDIINKYFEVDNLSEIKKYVSAAHEWLANNKKQD